MPLNIRRAELWASKIEDEAGGLATKLAGLARARANLEFIFARRAPEAPGKGVVFVTPVKGPLQIRTARTLGFQRLQRVGVVRVDGPDAQGLAGKLTLAIAEHALSLKGFSASTLNKRCVIYLAFDSVADASRAIRALKKLKL